MSDFLFAGEETGQSALRVLEALRGLMSAQCTTAEPSFLFLGTEAFSLPKLSSHCLGRCTSSSRQVDSTVCQAGLVGPTMGRVFFSLTGGVNLWIGVAGAQCMIGELGEEWAPESVRKKKNKIKTQRSLSSFPLSRFVLN